MNLIACLMLAVTVMLCFVLMRSVVAETGPNCPGRDPAWLGWCAEAPDAQ